MASNSLRITPLPSHATSTSNTTVSSSSTSRGAPSVPGLHDTLRSSLSSTAASSSTSTAPGSLSSSHPLEARLSHWQATQQSLHSNLLRRNFGIHMPLRMAMEQTMVAQADSFRPSVLGAPSRVHGDILQGRDADITWEDVYAGQDGLKIAEAQGGDGQGGKWTDEMETKVGMGKW